MAFSLNPLPWAKDALSPHISAETIDFHYSKHHAGYVKKLNDATKDQVVVSLPELLNSDVSQGILNIAGQVWNHDFYWRSMTPDSPGEPTGEIRQLIKRDFGSFDKFKASFSEIAAGHFGSGWAWLALKDGVLEILQTHDGDSLIRGRRGAPLLVCDVWEHAYYIDRRNDRAKYIEAWWKVINWDFANENLASALKK